MTLSKEEQLYRIANHIASAKGGLPEEWQPWADEIESDIRRLERRERDKQEAIGEVRRGEYDDSGCYPDAKVVCLHDQADWAHFPDGFKLYAAPPAPVSLVNRLDTLLNGEEATGNKTDDDIYKDVSSLLEHALYLAERTKAYRAAMHAATISNSADIAIDEASQSFGNSEQLNSPVIPDGWIKCSERMPPEATMVLGRCDNDYDFVNLLGGKLKIFCMGEWRVLPGAEITHWQPLPPAPKQESE